MTTRPAGQSKRNVGRLLKLWCQEPNEVRKRPKLQLNTPCAVSYKKVKYFVPSSGTPFQAHHLKIAGPTTTKCVPSDKAIKAAGM